MFIRSLTQTLTVCWSGDCLYGAEHIRSFVNKDFYCKVHPLLAYLWHYDNHISVCLDLWACLVKRAWIRKNYSSMILKAIQHGICQGSGTYGSRARCGSFDDGIWLTWYFLNTIVTNETFCNFPSTRLQKHQQHNAAPEVALTVRSMLFKINFRHLPLFKIVDFA